MTQRKQQPPVRLPPKIHAMVDEQVRALMERGYTGSFAAFVKAGVLELLKLDTEEQKKRVYAIEQTTDDLMFQRRAASGLRRTEPPLTKGSSGTQRKAGGMK